MSRVRLHLGVTIAALAVCAFGAAVMVGQHLDVPWLYRWQNPESGVAYRTGLCFLLGGASVLLLLMRRTGLSLIASGAVAALALLNLLEIAFEVRIIPDLAYLEPADAARVMPGKIAPLVSGAFVLASVAMLDLSAVRKPRVRLGIPSVLGSLVCGVGLIGLTQYILGPEGGSRLMAAQTGAALMVFGAAVTGLATVGGQPRVSEEAPWLAVAFSVTSFVAAFFVWLWMTMDTGRDPRQGWVDAGNAMLMIVLASAVLLGVTVHLIQVSRRQARVIDQEREDLEDFFEHASIGLLLVNRDGVILRANQTALDMLGHAREDYVGRRIADFHVDEEPVERLMRTLASGGSVRQREFRLRCKNGSIRHVLIDSDPCVRDGEFHHNRCFMLDITERKHAERRLAAEHAVTRILAESGSPADAVPAVLKSIGEGCGFTVVMMWRLDPDADRLRCEYCWSDPSTPCPAFETISRGTTFACGAGLPGRVWETGQPEWVSDLSEDASSPRREMAALNGLRCGLAVPILVDDTFFGVIELFARAATEPERPIKSMLSAVASELGQLLQRRLAERQNIALNRELARRSDEIDTWFEVSPIGLAIAHDPRCENVRINAAMAQILGVSGNSDASGDGRGDQAPPYHILRNGGEVPAEELPMAQAAREGLPLPLEDLEVVRADGSRVPVVVLAEPLFDEEGRVRGCLSACLDMSHQTAMNRALERLNEISVLSGAQFHESIVRALAESLGCRHAMVAELVGASPDRARSLAMIMNGELVQPFEYTLRGTPCANVMQSGLCHYNAGVAEQFPEDQMLGQMGVQSYIGVPLRDASGQALGLLIGMHDRPLDRSRQPEALIGMFATRAASELARQKWEEALSQSQALLSGSMDALLTQIVILDERGTILQVNSAWSEFAGALRGGSAWGVGTNYIEACQDEGRIGPCEGFGESAAEGIRAVIAEVRRVFELEYACHTRGEERWFLMRVTRFGEGKSLRIVVAHEDVTRRKLSELKIAGSEERLRLATQAADLGTWDYRPQDGELVWDERCREVFGVPEGMQPTYERFLLALHVDDRLRVDGVVRACMEPESGGAYDIEYRVIGFTGNLHRWVRATGQMYYERGVATRFVGTVLEVTKRRNAETALRESEARFRSMADAAPVFVWTSTADGARDYFNANWLNFTGEPMEREINDGWLARVHASDRERCENTYVTAFDARQRFAMEYRLRRFDGAYRWFLDIGAPRQSSDGEFLGYVGSCIDVTSVKEAEAALRTRAWQQEAIARLGQDALAGRDLEQIFRETAAAVADSLDCRFAAVWESKPNHDHVTLLAACGGEPDGGRKETLGAAGFRRRVLNGPRPLVVSDWSEERGMDRPGLWSGRTIAATVAVPIEGSDGAFGVLEAHSETPRTFQANDVSFLIAVASVLGTILARHGAEAELDRYQRHLESLVEERTTELQRSSEQLRTAERLASIGTLAAGLGHDMGNILLPLICRLDTLDAMHMPERAREDLHAVRRSVEYLRQLSASLRLFALDPSDSAASRGPTRLADWWGETSALLRRAMPKDVELEVDVADTLPDAAIAPHQLSQIALNLFANAADAMQHAVGPRVRFFAHVDESHQWIRLSLRDNGTGMSDEVRRRALDPFFTTKRRGMSTGLGLSLVHGIMQSIGGGVEIHSVAGQGTTITLKLPAISRVSMHETAGGPPLQAAVRLNDSRRAAYVRVMLRTLGFVASHQPRPGMEEAREDEATMLLIVDGSDAAVNHARAFMAERPERRVIILGEPSEPWEGAGVTVMSGVQDLAALRSLLHEAAQELAGALS